MRGGDQTFCVECKELVSSGCAYALCPVRLEKIATDAKGVGGERRNSAPVADDGSHFHRGMGR